MLLLPIVVWPDERAVRAEAEAVGEESLSLPVLPSCSGEAASPVVPPHCLSLLEEGNLCSEKRERRESLSLFSMKLPFLLFFCLI